MRIYSAYKQIISEKNKVAINLQGLNQPVKIDEFDELTAVIRLILLLYKNPNSKTTKILKSSVAGQRAFYSAKQFLDDNGLLAVDMSTGAALYSLSEKGKKVAENLAEIEKILGP
jgi:predicted transcriptional regulator